MLTRNVNAIQEWYDDHAAEFAEAAAVERPFIGQSPYFQERLNRFKLWAIDHSGIVDLAGKSVLEFGAGHGRLALSYPDMASYTGVDCSKNLVDIGNRRLERAALAGRARLVHGDVDSFHGTDLYDVVCSLGMMCYFAEPEPVVLSMLRVLKPGGTLFFDFRCASWIYSPLRRVKWLLRPPTGGSGCLANPHHIEALLAKQGLQDIRVVSREFPLLATLYASTTARWPLALRNAIAESRVARPFATEAWAFARKPAR